MQIKEREKSMKIVAQYINTEWRQAKKGKLTEKRKERIIHVVSLCDFADQSPSVLFHYFQEK